MTVRVVHGIHEQMKRQKALNQPIHFDLAHLNPRKVELEWE